MNIISRAEDWNAEYERKGIPSSFRNEPSGSLTTFLRIISERGFSGSRAIDIGCGTGRNALALARAGFEVTAIDFASSVVERFEQELRSLTEGEHIKVRCHDVTLPWPLDNNWADVAIDTFCFKHQAPLHHRKAYISEICRVLRKKGLYLLTLADVTDGYYSRYIHTELGENIIVDPENDIPSVLYNKADVINLFSDFKLIAHQEKRAKSVMHGEIYDRFTHLFVFELQ